MNIKKAWNYYKKIIYMDWFLSFNFYIYKIFCWVELVYMYPFFMEEVGIYIGYSNHTRNCLQITQLCWVNMVCDNGCNGKDVMLL